LQLILELQADCKQPVKELSKKLNLSITPIRERIKKLETNGAIDRYAAILNPSVLGKGLTVYCTVTLIKHQEKCFKEFEKFASTLNEVVEIIYVGGSHDYLLKVVLGDMKDFENFIVTKISRLDIISNIQSSFVIRQIDKRLSFL
tara:strand:- start:55 stop:489 length:435 start_codon:yes stop_codon:yes gene_type:complete